MPVVIETRSEASVEAGDEGAGPGVLSVMSSGFEEGLEGVMGVGAELAMEVAFGLAVEVAEADLASGIFWLVFREFRFGMDDRSALIFLSAARHVGKPGMDAEGKHRRLAQRAFK